MASSLQSAQTYGSGGGASFVESGIASGKQGIVVIRFATSGNTYETSLGGKPTNVQIGSRFEETDTRKIYYRDDIDFKELDGAEATNYRSDSWYEQLTGDSP